MRHWDPAANDLEQSLSNLFLGQGLASIRYYEFDYESEEFRGHEDGVDTLDLALDLVWDDGRSVCITTKAWWDANESGLDLQAASYETQCLRNGPCKSWDVANEARWTAFKGSRIIDARLYWLWDDDAQELREPGDLLLTFEESRSLVLAAGSYDGKRFLVGPGYKITVIFDINTARRFGVGPYAPLNFKRTLS